MKKKIAVWNKLFAWLLVFVMMLSMTPADALATEGNDVGTVIDEAEGAMIDSDCSDNEEELSTSDDPLNESSEAEIDENLEETPVEISENVSSLQEQINALPTGEEYRNMSAEEQDAVYELAASVSDAYIELSEEDQAKLDLTGLEELFAVMNEGVETYNSTGSVTFLNSGYPYGKNMSSSNITLVIETESAASSYQWQMSDSKDGTFTDIADATANTYTFTPTSGTWYRCVVDGTASEAVMAVKSGEDGRIWTNANSWYIGNGSMAYMTNNTMFDVTGLYTKNSTNYMLQTSYSKSWNLYSSTSAVPGATSYSSSTTASLDALRVAFDASDAYNIIFEADLADGQQAFSFGCDTQLGNSNTSGGYSDKAALNAMVKNGVLQQVAMIGAGTVESAADTDPAFVIAPVDPASAFWIGRYSARQTYAYNTSGGTATETIDGQNVVTLLEGIDSGMTMSWMNIPSGGTVRFRFSVGDVAHTGAVSGKVDYEKETLTGLESHVMYTISYMNEEGNTTTYTVMANENGEISLSGTDENGSSYDFAGKTLTIAKTSSEDTPAVIEVVGRPETPDRPSDPGDDKRTTTSVTIVPNEGQQYAYSTDDGTTWTILDGVDENGNYVISGLTEGAVIKIRTRQPATSTAPASRWSESTEVKLKSTVKATVTEWSGTYDKKAHSISVNVTSPTEGASIAYSTEEDGSYDAANPTFIDAGTYRVYYCVTAPDYYPSYGSATVKIDPKEVELEWSNTELTYNGSVQTPVATVKEGSLYKGDSCSVSVSGGAKNYSESAYTAFATGLSNNNYALPEVVTQSFTIAKKELEFQFRWGNTNLTYNGKPQAPTVTLVEDATGAALGVTGAALEVTGSRTDVGTGSAVVRFRSDIPQDISQNYDLKGTTTIPFKIFPKKITSAMIDADTSYLYTGSDISPILSIKDGETPLSEQTDYTLSGDVSGKDEGNYTVTVKGTGNYTGTVDIAYKITDSQMPTGTIKVSTKEWKTLVNFLSFGLFYKERQTVTITAEDEGSGVGEVSYFLTSSSDGMDQTALAALADSKWTKIANGGSFAINPDNKYVIYAKITDKSGNVTYLSTDGIVLDRTAPIITGIENNKTYCAQDVTFTVFDANGLASVKIDDTEQTIGGSYRIAATGVKATHTIVAEDVAGNKTTCTITINESGSHSFGEWEDTTPATCEEDGVQRRICSECGLVETQSKAKIGHNYIIDVDQAHFVWKAKIEAGIVTGYDATAYFVCANDPSHVKFAESCTVTRTETQEPTQEQEGEVTYIASAEYKDRYYSAQRKTTLAKLVKLNTTGSSNIYTSTSVADEAPDTKLGSELDADLAKDLLTAAEKENYNSSSVATAVTVYLEVQNINDAVVTRDASEVEAQIADLATKKLNTISDVEVKTGAAYLDLSMYKNVKTEKKEGDNVISESDTTTQITDTGKDITITMDIPTGIPQVEAGFTRTYHVIRVHDGKAEVLPTTHDGEQLTFMTSKFSTYAVTYVDVKDVSVNPPAESNGSGSVSIPATKVTISADKNRLTKKGDTLQLTVDVTPSNATDKKISWSSSDPSIATVDENGKVTAVGNGTVTITAKTANGKTATFTIVVDLETEKEEEKSEDIDYETNVILDTTFRKLHLAEAKATKNTVKVSWKKVSGADGYVLYGAPCNTKGKINKMKKVAVIKNGSKITYTDKKLKSGIYYKYCIKAYKLVNGKKVWLAKSKTIHVTTAGGKYGNAKAVKVSNTQVTLKKGKSLVIKAQQIAGSKPIKQHENIKFESTNTKIATVTKNGRIKAKGKGICDIYVYAQNGVYKRIRVTVK